MATPRSATGLGYSEASPSEAIDLDRVYREHASRVSTWIARLSGSDERSEVQDLLHEVFLIVERKLPEFRGDAKLTTWLYSIAVQVVVARRRKARFRRFLFRRAEPEIRDRAPLPETPLGALERARAHAVVYTILDRLSERDRTLLILFELEGLPGEEIANILGVGENAMWVALHRARERFKRTLQRAYPEFEADE
jgi:RNA polymerase sigma-70 factor (ECF subfamily)